MNAWTDPEPDLPPIDTDEGQRARLDVVLRGLRGMQVVSYPTEVEPLRSRELVNEWLEDVHGHAGPVAGWRFALGLRDQVSLVGVIVAARPVAPAGDPDRTIEITRLALLEGAPKNSASKLLGAACRAAKAMGYTDVQSFTLEHEDGACYRAAGFEPVGTTPGGRWSRRGRARRDDERNAELRKTKWVRRF